MNKMIKGFRKYAGKALGCLAAAFLFSLALGTMEVQAYVNTVGIVKDGGGANIRLKSSTDSEVLASVEGGAKVEICGTEVGADGYTWYKVYINGNTIGYVRSDLVTDTGEETGGIASDDLKGGPVGGASNEPNPGQGEDGTDTPPEGEGSTPPEGEAPAEGGDQTPEDGGQTPDGGDGSGVQQPVPVLSSEAALYALSISTGTLTPAFSPEITQYTLDVASDVTEVSVFGVPASADAVVSENYGFSNLVPGSNMAVVTVQAADGTRLSYVFTVNRGGPSDEVHYAVPGEVGSGEADAEGTVQKKGGSHTGLIIFLVIVILIMIAALVAAGLRLRDYRRDLYGEDSALHIRESIPLDRIFQRRKGSGGQKNKRRARYEEEDDEDDEDADGDDEEDADEDDGGYDSDDLAYSVSDSIMVSPMSTGALSGAVGDTAGRDAGQYSRIDLDEDALEDITEREATLNERVEGKNVWKSVNFMTPSDDLEFEFMDLDDNE